MCKHFVIQWDGADSELLMITIFFKFCLKDFFLFVLMGVPFSFRQRTPVNATLGFGRSCF